jgi:hypothetical protein
MTGDDEIEELGPQGQLEQEEEMVEVPALVRRGTRDIDLNVHGEIIQMPCLDVQRFQREHQLEESFVLENEDGAQGTIEQIANIQPHSWNKRWKSSYAQDFPGDVSSITDEDNFVKFKLFLQHRLGAWQSSMEQLFDMTKIGVQKEGSSIKFRIPWKALMNRRYQECPRK